MIKSESPSIGVVVPTRQARHHLTSCLGPLLLSNLRPRVLVIDSSSDDGTLEHALKLGAEALSIPKETFNHGLTRELGRKHLDTDIVVMLTQDSYAVDSQMLEKLVEPIVQGHASIAYARQKSHFKAGVFETFHRHFNYPAHSHVRGIEDLAKYGVLTFFCSNSCAAYCNRSLDEIGGFSEVLLGEDTVAAAKMLHKGHKIAYVADAVVRHSHRYSLLQEFKRNFDTGYARHSYGELLQGPKCDFHYGLEYVKALGKQLCCSSPHLLPYAAVQSLCKWTGYQLGKHGHKMPTWFKRACSSHKLYWQ